MDRYVQCTSAVVRSTAHAAVLPSVGPLLAQEPGQSSLAHGPLDSTEAANLPAAHRARASKSFPRVALCLA